MENIKDVAYEIKINYVNSSGDNVSACKRMQSDGYQLYSIQVGDICVTEETIDGRILGGRYEDKGFYCGYRYDYKDGEMLININDDVLINDAVSLIDKTKRRQEFLSVSMALSVLLRNNYRVVVLDKGSIDIKKTVSSVNDKNESCSFQENITISRVEGDETFKEQHKEHIYKINNDCVVDKFIYDDKSDKPKILNNDLISGQSEEFRKDVKSQLRELVDVIKQSPKNYSELSKLVNCSQIKL